MGYDIRIKILLFLRGKIPIIGVSLENVSYILSNHAMNKSALAPFYEIIANCYCNRTSEYDYSCI